MEDLLKSISTELNNRIMLNVFRLEKQIKVIAKTDGSTTIELKVLRMPSLANPDMPLAELKLPSDAIEFDIDETSFRLQITECALWLVNELCLNPENMEYMTELMGSCFGQPNLTEMQVCQLVGLAIRAFFDDLETDSRKPMLEILVAPLCACALDGTQLDSDSVAKLSKHIHYFHSAVTCRENPASNFDVGVVGKLPLPVFVTESIKKYDILKITQPTYMESSVSAPAYMGAELQTMKNTKFLLVSNPLLVKHMGKGLMLPFVYAKNAFNLDGTAISPKFTVPNMYTRARGTEYIPGVLDFRRPKNADLVGRFEFKVTEDELGNKITINDVQKNQIKIAIFDLFGLNEMDYKPKPLQDALSNIKAKDVIVDSFDFNNGHFDLNMIPIPKGSYLRPIDHKTLGKIDRTIKITKPFLMLETKVSSALYNAVQNPTRDLSNLNPSSHTVVAEGMSWLKAVDFCNKLSLLVGLDPCYSFATKAPNTNDLETYVELHPNLANKDILVFCNQNSNGYRLPTEAEWEYVGLAGGSNHLGTNATSISELSKQVFLPMHDKNPPLSNFIHERKPNAWGVEDMLGRHLEYCTDANLILFYVGTDNHALVPQIDPIAVIGLNSKATTRVAKGCPEAEDLSEISVFARRGVVENRGFSHNSFRICRSL